MIVTLRYAFRSLRRAPLYTTVSVVMLALGIGMSTSAFSLTNVALFRGLALPESERLFAIFRTTSESKNETHSPATFIDLRAATSSFEALAATFTTFANVSVNGEPPQQAKVLHASANFFTILGVQPRVGRGFSIDEDDPGRGNVVVLTHKYWITRFGGDAQVLGSPLRVGGETMAIVGVLPPAFDLLPNYNGVAFVRPLTLWPGFATLRNAKWLGITGRLKEGSSFLAAQSELSGLATRLAVDFPADNANQGLRAVPLAASVVPENTRRVYWLITGLSLFVLLIACANLASVQLARALERRHEFAVRSALGASRVALLKPLVAETAIISVLGFCFGLLCAAWANSLISHFRPGTHPVLLDPRVTLFVGFICILTGIVFGLLPAILATRINLIDMLKESSRGSTGNRTQKRLKSILVVLQFAMAFILVSAAATLTIAIRQALSRDVGWTGEGIVMGTLDLPRQQFNEATAQRNFISELKDKLSGIPGVKEVSVGRWVPLYDYFTQEKVWLEGGPETPPGHEPTVLSNAVDSRFPDMLRMRLVEGRGISNDVRPEAPQVCLVNEAFANRFWQGQSAVGKRIRFTPHGPWTEIVGVLKDVKMAANFAQPASRFQVYLALVQNPTPYCTFLLHTDRNSEALDREIRSKIASINSDVVVTELGSLPRILERALSHNSFLIVSIGSFAAVGLLIALVGFYGVMTHLVTQAHREIGIRVALGASPRDIVVHFLSFAGRLIVIGSVLGYVGTFFINQYYQRTMPELDLPGPIWQIALMLALALAGLISVAHPVYKASRLRAEELLHED